MTARSAAACSIIFIYASVGIALLLCCAWSGPAALLTGLGVGGVALALAAQKTLENLFGGIGLIMRDIVRPGRHRTDGGRSQDRGTLGLGSTLMRTQDSDA